MSSRQQHAHPPALGLSPAELSRSVLAAASGLRLGVLNLAHDVERHAVAGDGSLVFCAPAGSPAELTARRIGPSPGLITVTATDVVGVAMPDRIRGRVTLSGRLGLLQDELPGAVAAHLRAEDLPSAGTAPSAPILQFTPHRVCLQWICEGEDVGIARSPAQPVDLDAYRRADPDPMFVAADEWLVHLDRGHGDTLRLMAESVAGPLDDRVTVRPLLVDRAGLVLRLGFVDRDRGLAGRHRDVRIGFDRRVRCGCQLREQLNGLLERLDPDHEHPGCDG